MGISYTCFSQENDLGFINIERLLQQLEISAYNIINVYLNDIDIATSLTSFWKTILIPYLFSLIAFILQKLKKVTLNQLFKDPNISVDIILW